MAECGGGRLKRRIGPDLTRGELTITSIVSLSARYGSAETGDGQRGEGFPARGVRGKSVSCPYGAS